MKRKTPLWIGGVVLFLVIGIASFFLFRDSQSPVASVFSLDSTPENARVFLNDLLIGSTPIAEYELESAMDDIPVRVELGGFVSVDTVLKTDVFHFLELTPEDSDRDPEIGTTEVLGDNDVGITTPPPVQPGVLVLRAVPDGAAYIDNRQVPPQESYSVSAGNHTVRFSSSRYGSANTTVRVAPGQTREVVVYFEAALTISATPSSVVFINGDFVGEATPYFGSLGPGTYTIRVERDGYLSSPADTTITIEPSFSTQLEKRLPFRLIQQ